MRVKVLLHCYLLAKGPKRKYKTVVTNAKSILRKIKREIKVVYLVNPSSDTHKYANLPIELDNQHISLKNSKSLPTRNDEVIYF